MNEDSLIEETRSQSGTDRTNQIKINIELGNLIDIYSDKLSEESPGSENEKLLINKIDRLKNSLQIIRHAFNKDEMLANKIMKAFDIKADKEFDRLHIPQYEETLIKSSIELIKYIQSYSQYLSFIKEYKTDPKFKSLTEELDSIIQPLNINHNILLKSVYLIDPECESIKAKYNCERKTII